MKKVFIFALNPLRESLAHFLIREGYPIDGSVLADKAALVHFRLPICESGSKPKVDLLIVQEGIAEAAQVMDWVMKQFPHITIKTLDPRTEVTEELITQLLG